MMKLNDRLTFLAGIFIFCLGVLFFSQSAHAQTLTQSVRGMVVDKVSKQMLSDVTVMWQQGALNGGTKTDQQGRYELKQVPVGRIQLQFSLLGYGTVILNEVMLNTGKELILHIEMEERVVSGKTVVIRNKRDKDRPMNEMAVVSARMFSVDETNRYAGSLNDPARMAQNFAGVQANGDTRNDIIIRGNSPLGVQWRIEGIEIPNPNHFSGIGTSGGAISILNNNNLSNSDFLTGAFPAQYGNAMAGIFDLRLRNGNDKKREYTVMFGMNGLEAGVEGPINQKQGSSFIFNYRYSTLGVFNALGINFGAASVPRYQDGVFKIHLPSRKIGVWDVFGLGGYNTSSFYSKDYDTSGRKLNPLPKGFNTSFDNFMGVAGLSNTYRFSNKIYGRGILTYSLNGNFTKVDSLFDQERQSIDWLNRVYREDKLSAQYVLHAKWNAKHNTQLGIYYNRSWFVMKDSIYLTALQTYRRILDEKGAADLMRFFVQHQYRPHDKLSIIAGIHGLSFLYNRQTVLEPRLGIRYQVRSNIWLNAGAGIHHQQQPMITYFHRIRLSNGTDTATNKNLGFSKSAQVVAGLDWLPFKDIRLKFEAYYQSISGVPIERISSSYSLLNEGAFYYFINRPYLQNAGKGYNQGVELTLEKFFSKQYYFLVTASLYESKYQGSDGVLRHTAFDGTYAANILFGYDYRLGKKGLLSLNAKATFLGGRRYTPIDENLSQLAQDAVFVDSLAFSQQHPAYFRPDIRIAYRLNWKKISQEWALNINNFIDRDNIQALEYDRTKNKVGYSYQIGFFPVVQYRLEF